MEYATYMGLFLSAFFAATIVPAQSEAVLAALVLSGHHPIWLLLGVASCANIMGSMVNLWMGYAVVRLSDKSWFPVKPQSLARAQKWYGRYGRWSLLLSWVPIVGDPITVAAGVMKEKWLIFLVIVAAAKTGRYAAVIYALT